MTLPFVASFFVVPIQLKLRSSFMEDPHSNFVCIEQKILCEKLNYVSKVHDRNTDVLCKRLDQNHSKFPTLVSATV